MHCAITLIATGRNRAHSELARRVLLGLANMGKRTSTSTKPTAKLSVRKETIRQLRTLSDDELLAAIGGMWSGPPPPPRPSNSGC